MANPGLRGKELSQLAGAFGASFVVFVFSILATIGTDPNRRIERQVVQGLGLSSSLLESRPSISYKVLRSYLLSPNLAPSFGTYFRSLRLGSGEKAEKRCVEARRPRAPRPWVGA